MMNWRRSEMAEKNQEDNSWFKRFMGMPEPGSERREKIELWLGILIGIAILVAAVVVLR